MKLLKKPKCCIDDPKPPEYPTLTQAVRRREFMGIIKTITIGTMVISCGTTISETSNDPHEIKESKLNSWLTCPSGHSKCVQLLPSYGQDSAIREIKLAYTIELRHCDETLQNYVAQEGDALISVLDEAFIELWKKMDGINSFIPEANILARSILETAFKNKTGHKLPNNLELILHHSWPCLHLEPWDGAGSNPPPSHPYDVSSLPDGKCR